ncbi:hypothetical protein BSIN_2105 [Burkholderia singularis]|uniref:Uncharacterized protein n=1 Tax=Burkholderia singularis TaxID=1503053 RepID=A0A238H0R0_9BURK|nr:hypothetical protein BSIN_2105 [Burkholderia singularis]
MRRDAGLIGLTGHRASNARMLMPMSPFDLSSSEGSAHLRRIVERQRSSEPLAFER